MSSSTDVASSTADGTDHSVAARIEAALDLVRPAIHRDGGDVWLVSVEDDVAYVQMIGACGGCPASNATLKQGIEAAVRAHVPEITRVEQI
ncbi:MAG: NifU family protein [Candidatus Eremiobacteraeota bacterium]|nr:NifU family protein [Candidatus Eremiobacteraeota bacterium]